MWKADNQEVEVLVDFLTVLSEESKIVGMGDLLFSHQNSQSMSGKHAEN